MKIKLFCIAVLCVILSVNLVGCSQLKEQGGNSSKIEYVDGVIASGKSIDDYYELEGESTCTGMVRYQKGYDSNDIIPVWCSKVKNGGSVAWKDNRYTYSDDVGSAGVMFHLAYDWNK